MNPTGYFYISRKLINSQFWLSEPFSRGQAWVDLIALANYSPSSFRIAGQLIELNRGQCGWSVLSLSTRWRWSRNKTRRFLDELESDKNIAREWNTRTTIITICNYEEYQTQCFTSEPSEGTTEGTTERTTEGTHKKKRKEKIKKDNIPPTPLGEDLFGEDAPKVNPIPEWMPPTEWEEFKAFRKREGKKLTLYSEKLAISNLTKLKNEGNDPAEVINQTILGCWSKFFPIDKNNNHPQKTNPNLKSNAKNL